MPGPPPPNPRMAQRPREKPMKVLGLGLARTGTLSTYTALKMLGYNSYHMSEMIRDNANGSINNWDAAVQAKFYSNGRRWEGEDFEKMLWRYDATTDTPGALFPEELIAAYPDAKVVLNVRDPEKWTVSVMDNLLYFISGQARWLYLRNFDYNFSGKWYTLQIVSLNHWSCGDIHNPEAYKKHGITEHNALVRRLVPKERLLEFHPSQGWGPLCEFLGKDVPDCEFPHINEGAKLKAMIDFILAKRIKISLMGWAKTAVKTVTPMAVVAGAGAWWMYTQS